MKNYLLTAFIGALLMSVFGISKTSAQCTSFIPYPINDPCVQTVIANDPFCCDNTWDAFCQTAYDDCEPGGGGCAAFSPYPANDPCYISVISSDPFCCDTNWDGACQTAYDDCDSGGGNPGGAIVVSTNTYSVPELVTDVLLGSCVEASDITFTGDPAAFGSFTNGTGLGFEEGIILCSGNSIDAPGPENGIVSTSFANPGDPLLDDLSGVVTNDAAVIEFEFVSPSDFVSFEYVFASHEYEGFTCSNVNDAFGFFISGPGYAANTNVALVPGTNTPVSINTVNQGFPSGIFGEEAPCTDIDPNYSNYSIYFNNNIGGPEIAYNGYTEVFTAELELVPCETYSIKLAIADGGDNIYDSAVFLKAGSFTSGLEVDVVAGTANATSDAIEGCEDGYFMFINQGGEISEPTDFNFEIGGTATIGDDYAPINNFVTFQPGQDTVIVSIDALLDGIDEGAETIVLTFPDACTCEDAPETVLNILDNNMLTGEINDDVTICLGGTANLAVDAGGSISEPYSYDWSNGSNTAEIAVSPAATTTYTATVTDACGGQSVELEVTVNVADEILVDLEAEICIGDNYTLPDGNQTGVAGEYEFEFLTNQGCDSIVTVNLNLIEIPETDQEIWICEGENYTLPDGSAVDDAGEYSTTLISVTGCDSVVNTTVNLWPNYEIQSDIAICEGESFSLPDGTTITDSGAYALDLQSENGCDSTVIFNLDVLPTYTQNIQASICGSEGYNLPDGSIVNEPGEYEVILSTVNGCDSIINTTLNVQGVVEIELNPTICENSTYNLPDGTQTNQAGSYEVTVGSGVCDTVYQIDISVIPAYETTIHESICNGDMFYLPNGNGVSTSGTYTLSYPTSTGCDSLINYQINVLPTPLARFSANPPEASIYDGPVQFFNQSIDAESIEWDFGDFGIFTANDPVVDFDGRVGKYPICLYVSSEGGCTDVSCIDYIVSEDFAVYIPNAFSPNEDGNNDLFFVQGRDIDPDNFHLQIFNRQGELVFETRNPEEKWDGGSNGATFYSQNEVYVYQVIVGAMSTREKYEFNGTVTVLR